MCRSLIKKLNSAEAFMTLLFAVLSVYFVLSFIIAPVQRYYSSKYDQQFERTYKHFKLRAIRNYYEVVEDMTFAEIEELYDINQSYDNIG